MRKPVHKRAEDIHLLGEFGILPEVVLIVVFKDQRNAPFRRVGKAFTYGVCRKRYALFNGEIGTSLSRQYAAILSAEDVGHVDPSFLPGNLFLPELRIKIG